MQEGGLNEPPAFPSDQDTEPVGELAEFEISETVTVNVAETPEFSDREFGEMATDVESGMFETDVLLLLVKIKVPSSAIAEGIANPTKESNGTSATIMEKVKIDK